MYVCTYIIHTSFETARFIKRAIGTREDFRGERSRRGVLTDREDKFDRAIENTSESGERLRRKRMRNVASALNRRVIGDDGYL